MRMNRRTEDFLVHYASKYYDPVKAHEYYERTKELKGRKNTRSTAQLNEEGKKIWEVSKYNIKKEKDEQVETAKTNRTNTVTQHRERANEVRESITNQLKELNDRLSNNLKSSVDAIKHNSSLSKAEKNARIAELRERNKNEKGANSQAAREQRQNVANELKSVVQATAQAYKESKQNIDASYEDIYQQEYDKILQSHKKEKKGKKSRTIPTSSSSESSAPKSQPKKTKHKTHGDVMGEMSKK